MRRAVLAGLALAALPAAAPGQNGPRYATVTDPEVTLRAGPSDKLPDTGTLPAGTRVIVESEDQNGWYAVVARSAGVSWVPAALVDFDPARGIPQRVKVEEPALLAAGKVGLAQPLVEYRKVKVPAGTVLKVIGPVATFDGRKWYPVEPPDEDFRYLPKTAVKLDDPVSTSFNVKATAPPGLPPLEARPAAGGGPAPGANPPGSPDRPASGTGLWARAVEAEQAGRYDEAEKLFFQVARDADPDLANRCFARIHTLREKQRDGAPPARPQEPFGRTPTPAESAARAAALPAEPTARDGRRPDPAPPADRPSWSAPATLVRANLALDGRQTYALETSPGVVVGYVVPGRGVDLNPYLRQRVRVYGNTYTHPNARKPYTVATDIQPER